LDKGESLILFRGNAVVHANCTQQVSTQPLRSRSQQTVNLYERGVYLGVSAFVQRLSVKANSMASIRADPPEFEVIMIENQKIRPAQVIGPLGESLTVDSLPPPNTTRWVVRRKAEVVAAVNGGLLSVDEVCDRYSLTLEEFAGWQRAVDRSGMPGLRVTRIQQYKSLYERQQRF
jgi:hypothetical protein